MAKWGDTSGKFELVLGTSSIGKTKTILEKGVCRTGVREEKPV